MQNKFFSIHAFFLVSATLLTQHPSYILGQEFISSKSRFNICGLDAKQGRYFLTREARLAMGPPRTGFQNDPDYQESLFFAPPLEGGVNFATKVLRAGCIANGSQKLFTAMNHSSAEELQKMLSDLSSPEPLPNQFREIPTVFRVVKVGTEPVDWPNSARNGHSDWIEPYRKGYDDSSSVYESNLHVVIIYDEKCKKPVSAGILKKVDMFLVSDFAKGKNLGSQLYRAPSISIWVSSFESITLSGNAMKSCEVFNLTTGSNRPEFNWSRGSKKHVASSLVSNICDMVFAYGDVATRDPIQKKLFDDHDQSQRNDLRDFDFYLEWAAAVIGPKLREQVNGEVIKHLESSRFKFNESPKYTHHVTARDKYLQILRSANSADLVVPPEPNGVPTPDSSVKNGSAQSEMAVKLLNEFVKLNVEMATNSKKVKEWVDARIAESIKNNPSIPKAQKNILITIEQSLEKDSTRIAVVSKSLLVGLDVFKRIPGDEKVQEEIRDHARKGDPYNAWRKTLTYSVDMVSDVLPGKPSSFVSLFSSVIGEILADATADICIPLGNRIAWSMWENGYSPWPPRYAKDEFNKGVRRPVYGTMPNPYPTVPAVPNGVPGLSVVAPKVPGKPPGVVPPAAADTGIDLQPIPMAGMLNRFQVPFVPVVTPIPLPPPIFKR